ncbi:hypothetical protein I6F35_03670 [Bradyrhizobium sp. BRP22]|uniref:hypothetical protein n=1 Tax=Bradyrhizobium sp. BRP22 TaxID=2793821 RepID=UPI001CD3D22D|nr:hypothetical protein [Bradyrhizobium sp. BRP22]MCA1452316.1 hypothetical protein [Bradyrhizobium sp. BRP22]
MLGRALIFATVFLVVAGFAANSAHAQPTNLEAGKSPSQIFAGTCSACHKSPRGLLKSVSASSLPGFLRQHYTTSSDMASLLASYLVSNGATDTRYQGKQEQAKHGKDAKQQEAARPAAPAEPERPSRRFLFPWSTPEPAPDAQQAAKPDADGLNPHGEGKRHRRNAKRSPQPSEAAPDGANPEQASEPRPAAKQKLGKRGKPSEDAKPEPAREETSKDDAAKIGAGKVDADKPSGSKPDSAKLDAPKENGGSEPAQSRSDPVPPVTPASPVPPAAAAAPSAPEPSASPSAATSAAPAAPQ